MEGDSEAVLKQFVFEVAGTHYENRQAVIRTLTPGQPVSLWRMPVEGKDDNAIAVLLEEGRVQVQVGWVPWVLNSLLKKMDLRSAEVSSIGTDPDGSWTKVKILVHYQPTEASEPVEKHGVRVAGVLDRMLYKSVLFARRIATLPTREIRMAIEVYDTEGALETEETRRSPKKRRKKNEREGAG